MSIRNVKTSCGCTKAYATSTPVERDDKAQVLIGIAISKDGPFSVKLSFDTTHGTIAIRLKGHASPRVAINTLQATFSEEDNLFKVPVTINDDSVPIDSLKFFVGDSAIAFTKLEDRKLVLDIAPKASNQVIATNITPFIGTVALPPASIRLAIPGEVDLLTKQVLSREGKFDLVFRGDLDAIADKTPTLHQKNERVGD